MYFSKVFPAYASSKLFELIISPAGLVPPDLIPLSQLDFNHPKDVI